VRKLIVSEFVTLDGVMEAPGGEEGHHHSGWVFDFMGADQERYKLDETLASEALLLGRVTYDRRVPADDLPGCHRKRQAPLARGARQDGVAARGLAGVRLRRRRPHLSPGRLPAVACAHAE